MRKLSTIALTIILMLLSACMQGTEPVVESSPTLGTESPVPSEESSPESTPEQPQIGIYDYEEKRIYLSCQTIDSFDFMLEIPKDPFVIESIRITKCEIAEGASLPYIKTLREITIAETNYIDIIKNNNHITRLLIGDRNDRSQQLSLEGLETFTLLEHLEIESSVADLSPLASCVSLEYLDITFSPDIDSVEALYNLPNLDSIMMHSDAVAKLPKEAREHFNYREGHGYDLSRPVDYDAATIVY